MRKPALVRRDLVLPATQALGFFVGIVVALLLGAVLLIVSDHSPAEVYERMFDSALRGTDSLSRTLGRATPLALTGLSVAVAGSMGLWNIGAEGQM
ncbi:MAG: ABC transporter permease, partial [bacterium]|nr:ABC transporter permease [bacterium]